MCKYLKSGYLAFALVLTIGAYLVAQTPPPNNPAPNNPPQYPQQPNQPVQPNQPNYNPPGNNPNYQPPQNPGNQQPQGQQQQQQMVARHVKQVIGANVTISGGSGVGTVEDIIFNDNGCIDYVVVVQNGKYVVMPYAAIQFNYDQRVATVNITQERYREVPTYTTQQLPTIQYYEPQFVTRVYGYYNIDPTRREIRQDRRDDRRDNRR